MRLGHSKVMRPSSHPMPPRPQSAAASLPLKRTLLGVSASIRPVGPRRFLCRPLRRIISSAGRDRSLVLERDAGKPEIICPAPLQLVISRHPRDPPATLSAPVRTATPAANHDTKGHSAALSEFGSRALNERQRAVNRKVQGSNPCSGVKSSVKVRPICHKRPSADALQAFG